MTFTNNWDEAEICVALPMQALRSSTETQSSELHIAADGRQPDLVMHGGGNTSCLRLLTFTETRSMFFALKGQDGI